MARIRSIGTDTSVDEGRRGDAPAAPLTATTPTRALTPTMAESVEPAKPIMSRDVLDPDMQMTRRPATFSGYRDQGDSY